MAVCDDRLVPLLPLRDGGVPDMAPPLVAGGGGGASGGYGAQTDAGAGGGGSFLAADATNAVLTGCQAGIYTRSGASGSVTFTYRRPVSPVPEPGSFALRGTGLPGWGAGDPAAALRRAPPAGVLAGALAASCQARLVRGGGGVQQSTPPNRWLIRG
jgi:hypothetical protein